MRLRHVALVLFAAIVPASCGFPDYTFQHGPVQGKGGQHNDAMAPESGAGAGGQPFDGSTVPPPDGSIHEGGPPDAQTGRCLSNTDCNTSPLGQICDTSTSTCVQCLPNQSGVCGVGLFCGPSKRCEVGCSSNLDCVGAGGSADGGATDSGRPKDSGAGGPTPSDAGKPKDASTSDVAGRASDGSTEGGTEAGSDASGDATTTPGEGGAKPDGATGLRCDLATHQCVGCASDANCPLGTVCDGLTKRCISGCSTARGCPNTLECCGSTCADLKLDPAHCGTCDKACSIAGSIELCAGGVCQSGGCAKGFADCNGKASDGCEVATTTDPKNCSKCGNACAAFPNAEPACEASRCVLGPCLPGFDDCEGDPTNGCETNTKTNPLSCGGCGLKCSLLNASASCVDSACKIQSCTAGYADCDHLPDTGCEVDTLGDAANCNGCGNVCVFAGAAAKCEGGVCKIDTCVAPRGDCNGDPTDGCETNKNLDTDNCGNCGAVCAPANATAVCSNGTCAIGSCKPGFADCNGDAKDGCEVNTDTDPANCAGCGQACSTNNATATCALGACSIKCATGFSDCDAQSANGCEVDTTKNVDNCGGCGKPCTTTGGTPSCQNGVCTVSSCLAPLADCDANSSNGCEVNTSNDADNCGGCGKACFAAKGTATCTAGACHVASCQTGYADCNGFYQDGCEALLSTPLNCGACGQVCVLPNANTSCTTGTCTIASCLPPFADCDGVVSNGCETNTETSAKNCGGCGLGCDSTNGFAFCTSGVCNITCAAGFGNCDADLKNGCETATTNNVQNCGGCGTVCSVQNGTPACLGTTCAIGSCNAGHSNCDLSYATGCEVSTATDPTNCGTCGRVCSAASGSPTCSGGNCQIACDPGFGDCDGNAGNGCETSLNSSVGNCGGCGQACVFANASATCFSGGCQLQACNAGFGNCDGVAVNGCEASLATLTDCGTCGKVCDLANASESCTSGTCTLGTCAVGFGNCDGAASNGCEVNTLTNASNCGACGNACSSNNGTATCLAGACAITCNANFGNCDGDATNGCEVALLTSANCGSCGTKCLNPNGTTACASGVCSPSCTFGFASCDGNPNNGCETDIQTTATSCGACGKTCANAHGTTSCVAGLCAPVCASGFGNCDGDPVNGCETALNTTANCGACGATCNNSNGTTTCTAGVCVPTCNAGSGNCDGNPANGCETNLQTSINNCGVCNKVCPSAGGTPNCVSGVCGVSTCNPGLGDCDGNAANGCETSLNTLTDCGSCGSICNLPNASESCPSGTCTLGTCSAGFANCDGVSTNGCEVNTNSSVANCGSCGTACSSANGTASCSLGACSIACDPGFGNCDSNLSNGCETNTQTSLGNCGACGTTCTNPNGSTACAAGSCAPTCNSGFANCDGIAANGCEANLNTGVSSCGGCGKSCTNANGTVACAGGVCSPTCFAGFADCDGNAANGCETNVQTSMSSCGACGNSCTNAHGTTTCVAGVCTPVCTGAFKDCDGNKSNGCETDTANSLTSCGACGQACSSNHGTPSCNNSTCAIACNSGFGNCDSLASNGCETTLSTTANCGACGAACSNANGTTACVSGACSPTCAADYASCDGNPDNGCERSISTLTDCGACNTVCDLANASESCVSGVCTLGNCSPGFANCDSNSANGCETNTQTSLSSCGSCGNGCTNLHGTTACTSGACVPTCVPGWGNCDGDATNGCETNTQSSTANCGSCGTACSLLNATATCSSGSCGILTCNAGFGNCDGSAADGCEANLNTSSANCGSCGNVCSNANGTTTCTGGVCVPSCASGFANCDGDPTNGCETSLKTLTSCGACGVVCDYANATESCSSGTCQLVGCDAGFGNCDGNAANGCETNTNTSTGNCGGCGAACSSANGTPTCSAGNCSITCSSGFGNCDGNVANGCETNTTTSTNHCGNCATACSFTNAGASCFAGACQLGSCNPGFGNCDGNAANGCETSLTTLTNCGACGAICDLANASESCASGSCTLGTCSAGFGNCDGVAANGCEVNTQTSVSSCGACGTSCSSANGTPSCALGACSITCNGSFGNCDTDVTNGCEASLNTTGNCGACGTTCSNGHGSTTCPSGTCTPTCSAGFGNCDGNANNGCETDTQSTTAHCGGCGQPCTNTNGPTSCVGGACNPTCNSGFGDCDGNARNGCETPLNTNTNCGACGLACSNGHGTTVCTAGACVPTCNSGFKDCDSNPANGCETNVNSDVNNCSTCGNVCPPAGGTPNCVNGSCGVTSCSAGLGDCDGLPGNGCETNLNTSLPNCGGCGQVCNLANATESCVSGTCTLGTCSAGFGNCDGIGSTGCETNTDTSATNCGTCGTVCNSTNGTPSCSLGSCSIACNSGFGNCDGLVNNGCETNLNTTLANCGTCGNSCTNANGSTACTAGTCIPTCNAGFANCDGNASNGCEANTNTSTSNCGGCGQSCTNANGSTVCSGGACNPTCNAGFGNCDSNPNNGCETNTNTSTSNCGGCGTICTNSNGTTSCVAGTCTPVCSGTFKDCDGVPANGCETNTATSTSNCGACGTVCSAANAVSSCNGSACSFTCNTGFGNCDGNNANGCEAPLNTTTNCGTCGAGCTNANGTTACVSGACSPTCSSGFASCDGNPSNGCERNINTLTDCGGCGAVCSLANAAESCLAGVCTLGACNAGFGNCDGSSSNGCETNTNTDISNCGSCGTQCTNAHGTTTCTTGACVPTCTAGFGNCDGIASNGCETNTNTTVTSCGSCGNACSFANAGAACSGGACVLGTCNTGFGNCDGVATNGCEANLSTSTSNCGACGTTCTNANGTTACTAGACVPTCAAGFSDCDGNPNNGCETNVRTLSNCGGCGIVCDLANAAESCSTGTCTLGACTAGFGNCDGNANNGCETNTNTSATNCGACGSACSTVNATPTCSAGSCSLTCSPGFGNCDSNVANGCETNTNTTVSNCGTCGNACSFANAAASCFAGACQLGSCNANFGNCDGNAANGCETSLTTLSSCGTCGAVCDLANAAESCASGSCVLGTCSAGFGNCDGVGANGCEVNTQISVANCGACGTTCSSNNGTASCALGACSITCSANFGNCDGLVTNGCEASLNTVANCGTCGTTCTNANGTTTCPSGVCTPSCNSGFGNCDSNPNNGCETNTQTSVPDCGGCGLACTNANGSTTCTAGACVPTCNAGFGNCDGNARNGCETATTTTSNCGACGVQCTNTNGTTACTGGVCVPTCSAGFKNCDGNPNNGCETNTNTDANNCNTCGNVCPASGGTPNCVGGVCGVASCNPGQGDCDGNSSNGCETNTNTSLSNCGACGAVCSRAHASASCVTGVCTLGTCNSGFGNCDGNATNGCETSTDTNASNCGACGTVCNGTNGSPGCSLGACTIACNTGFGNCDGLASTGCEINTNTSTSNCGACGNACTNANGSTTCTTGVCVPTCNANFGNCDGNANNGCEANFNTSVTSCGGCGITCTNAHGTTTCSGGTCVPSCSAGFADCDGNPKNGCETATSTDINNCGACGTSCTNANGTTSCVSGVCTPVCSGSFKNCDGNPNNGCETNTDTSLGNCGSCGSVCSGANATPTCSLGSCSISCNSGFGNCDGLQNNGCEASLNTTSNCGTCGTQCTNANGTTTCTAGACVPTCAANFKNCDGNANNGCERSIATLTDCGDCNVTCNLANASETCPGGVCTLGTCSAGFGNCDSNNSNGCETNTNTSLSNCGACGTQCTNANGTTTCTTGACVPTCNTGFGNCDGNAVNGCETNTNTSVGNCGSCGAACNSTNGTASCSAGACSISCNSGFGNCDGFASTGCEVNLTNTTANCGTCGTACTNGHGTTQCTSSACVPSCSAGFGNCDGNAVNGCETGTTTDINHCGSCSTVCTNPHGTTSCASSACVPVCTSGFGDCDSNAANGCETSTDTSVNNCGSCGHVCSAANASSTCSLGACSYTCNAGFSDCDGNTANGCEHVGSTCCTNHTLPPSVNVDVTQWSANFLTAPNWNCTTSTATTASLSSSGTSIAVTSTTGFPTSGKITIDTEIIAYTGTTATSFTGLTRGQLNTTAASHSSGAAVGGVTVIDSAAGTITSTGCTLGTLDFTNNASQTGAGGPTVMVVRLTGLTVSNSHFLRLQGDKPIILLVAGNVVVDSGGKIDASANGKAGGPGGASANATAPSWCSGSTGTAGTTGGDSSGGGGGGFGKAGGPGGYGNGNPPAGGAAGGVSADTDLKPLRGGCAGAKGGDSNADEGSNYGGGGGGAFQISASGTITIGTGTNNAYLSAAGGGGDRVTGACCNGDGGNGGGSGGGILLVSPASASFGTNGAGRANAGSGGGGSEGGNSTAGANGSWTTDTAAAGGGGTGAGNGGNGGLCKANASGLTNTAGAQGQDHNISAGGGGGGGGGLVIVTTSAAVNACD